MKKLMYLMTLLLFIPIVLADYGMMGGSGMMGTGMGFYWLIYFVIFSFVFSVIFWWTRGLFLKNKK